MSTPGPSATQAADWLTAAVPPPAAWMGVCSSGVTGRISPADTKKRLDLVEWEGGMDRRMDGWMDGGVKTDVEIKQTTQRLDALGAGEGTLSGEEEIELRLVDKLSLHLSQ